MRTLIFAITLLASLIASSQSDAQQAQAVQPTLEGYKQLENRRDWGGLLKLNDDLFKSVPLNPSYWSSRAFYLTQMLRYEEAVADANKSIKMAPQFGTAWTNLGIALWRLGRHQEAIDALKEAARLSPRQTWPLVNLWGLLTETQRYADIPEVIKQVRSIDPKVATTFLHSLGDPTTLAKRLSADPESPEVGDIQCRNSDKALALSAIDDGKTALAGGDAPGALAILEKASSQIKVSACRHGAEDLALRDLLLIAQVQSLRIADALGQRIRTRDYSGALAVASTIAEKLERRFGRKSPEYLRAELAKTYIQFVSAHSSEALGPSLDAYALANSVLGPTDKTTQWFRLLLGTSYFHLDRYDDARSLLVPLYEESKQYYGENDPLTWLTFYEIYQLDKEVKKQSPFTISADDNAKNCGQILGITNKLCLEALSEVASDLSAQGKYDAAEALNQKIRAMLVQAYGSDSPDILMLDYALAEMFYEAGQFPPASDLLEKLVPALQQRVGRLAPTTLEAKLLQACGRRSQHA